MDHLFDTNISFENTTKHTLELQHKSYKQEQQHAKTVGVATGDSNKMQKRLRLNNNESSCF